MSNPPVSELLDLRIIVLSLGENQHFGWWKSQFLSSTGLSFLGRVFPRTKIAAAVRSATRAAQKSHDSSIGRGEVVHLFRIPALEEAIEENLSKEVVPLLEKYLPKLNNREELLHLLSSLTGGVAWPKQSGPIRLSQSQWGDIQSLASIYFQGFTNKTPVYPYFID